MHTVERVITTCVLAALALGLWRLVSPKRPEGVAAATAAVVIGALDVTVELVLGLLGVWRYRLSMSVAGIPIDLLVDVSLVALLIALGAVAVERRCSKPRCSVAYVAAVTLVLGTWGVFKNMHSSAQGTIAFARRIGVGTAWFVVGNYLALLVLAAGVTAIYRVVRTRKAGTKRS